MAGEPGEQLEVTGIVEPVGRHPVERRAGGLDLVRGDGPVEPGLREGRVVGPTRQPFAELGLGLGEVARSGGQVRPRDGHRAPVAFAGRARPALELAEVPLQREGFEVERDVFAQDGKPAVEVARGQERLVAPGRFEQATGLDDPPLLPQQGQEEVPQAGDFRARVPQGRAEHCARPRRPARAGSRPARNRPPPATPTAIRPRSDPTTRAPPRTGRATPRNARVDRRPRRRPATARPAGSAASGPWPAARPPSHRGPRPAGRGAGAPPAPSPPTRPGWPGFPRGPG